MAWEVVTASFETELHARWSIFFDRLEVAWLYEPCAFRDTAECEFTPTFWLPDQRIWFDAWVEAPPAVMSRWRCFATAAAGRRFEPGTEDQRAPGEPPAERATPLHVDEPWPGMALLSLGPIPCGAVADDTCKAWGSPSEPKMSTANDAPHRWTVCPACGMFGAGATGVPRGGRSSVVRRPPGSVVGCSGGDGAGAGRWWRPVSGSPSQTYCSCSVRVMPWSQRLTLPCAVHASQAGSHASNRRRGPPCSVRSPPSAAW
jgi:hypothetical protein